MITPRLTRLVRVPDLQSMRAAVGRLAPGSGVAVRRTAVLVPTRGAGHALRASLEGLALDRDTPAVLLPDILTRGELYQRLHASLPGVPPMLAAPDREVLLRRSARRAIAGGAVPPFNLRPGLLLEMLAFYDELRRRERTVDDFTRLTSARLADSAGIDRGAERLLRQTEFLCATYEEFESAIRGLDSVDEHRLRELLLDPATPPQRAYGHLIVTVADRAADPSGLHASDFVLLARLRGVERIDVVATEQVLAAGFHERIHGLLPGIEEVREPGTTERPVLVAPETADPDQCWFVSRDREEELADIVRWLKHRTASPHAAIHPPPLDRIGIVFQRPLPYLYLARQVFADGGVPYQALDALPLSAEPFAAAIDVVFSFIASEANRTSSIELLGSPHFTFSGRLSDRDIRALDEQLAQARYAGGWDRLATALHGQAEATVQHGATRATVQHGSTPSDNEGVERALACAREAAEALRGVADAASASAQIDLLLAFLRTFELAPPMDPGLAGRHLRARAGVISALQALRDAHARHDDDPLDVSELAGSVRRWIEAQTFAPRTGTEGVWLLDAAAAPYADLDEMRIVGLVERDWPEPVKRSIFYPSSILADLGWPNDASHASAARARFSDLVGAPRQKVSLSMFTLEEDAIVAPSPLTEEVEGLGLTVERSPVMPPARAFRHEAVRAGLADAAPAGSAAAAWLALRTSRDVAALRPGQVGDREPETYAISYLERYLDCPFKYFAARVLRLPEEREEEPGLSPIERGNFVHGVFETFFGEWQAAGKGTITLGNVAEALEMFEWIAERQLETLPAGDRPMERTHLLGSAAASGLAERAFAFEIEQGGEVVERLLEHTFEGEFAFTSPEGPRNIRIRGKADRVDIMADGTIRIIDYKLSHAPKTSRSLQLPIYGMIATQALSKERGRPFKVGAAGYVAFKEKDAFVPLGGRNTPIDRGIADGEARMVETVDAIERGEFPVDPDEPFRCQWCGYAPVCRKDYVGDE